MLTDHSKATYILRIIYIHKQAQGTPPTRGFTGMGRIYNNIPILFFSDFLSLLDFFCTDLCLRYPHNMCMKQAKLAVLSSYEASILSHTDKKSRASAITASKRTKAIMDSFLGCSGVMELGDGTSVEASIEELLIASAIAEELRHPKGLETVERLAKIRGEVEDKAVDVNVSLVDKDLQRRALE